MKIISKRSAYIASLLASSSIFFSTAAMASDGNSLTNILDQITQQISSFQSYIEETFSSTLDALSETLETDLQAAVDGAIGELGLPDPEALRTEIEEKLSVSEFPVYSGDLVSNELDRQITRTQASSTLSIEGQQQSKQELQSTQQSVESVQQAATAAQSEVITQNVMKQIAQQNAQQSAILGSLRADSIEAAQRQELTNLNLTNISRAVDGQNQTQQQEKVGAGFETLRTASFAGLF
ncbi:MAG: hypothetical protein F6J92_32395 [Symploca sp. SIO1A3]|nr:hypothetical protein [Symploca sp. SIO1A3]